MTGVKACNGHSANDRLAAQTPPARERITRNQMAPACGKAAVMTNIKEVEKLTVAAEFPKTPINAATATQRKVPRILEKGETFKMDAARTAQATPTVPLRVAA